MSGHYSNEPMLDMFIFETTQLIEQLEQSILTNEKSKCFTQSAINEIFRIMHTIKGSSAMMMFENISTLTHAIEDLFYFIREGKPQIVDYSILSDLVLVCVDFVKVEIEKIKNGDNLDGDAATLISEIKDFLYALKQDNTSFNATDSKEKSKDKQQQYYISPERTPVSVQKNAFKAVIYFDEGCEMENIRAFTIIHNLKEITKDIFYFPEDIIDNDNSINIIKAEGFKVLLKADWSYEKIHEFFMQTIFLKDLELTQLENDDEFMQFSKKRQISLQEPPIKASRLNDGDKVDNELDKKDNQTTSTQQSIISVNVAKMDKLMDLVGEMVIAEAMVIQNPDLVGLELSNFHKAARQLHKITDELQDIVMALRMVPISTTFQKMNRIVRDMSKKLDKEVALELIGAETEVDKNIIEHISDPLMHIIRNSIDHGIESQDERKAKGKTGIGTITLEAKNSGGEVWIIVRDNGRGLDKDKLLQKAGEQGLLNKSGFEMSDSEVYSLIFKAGFSTNDTITEFSGRGVGMDVVTKNIEEIRGSVFVDSTQDEGTVISIKIPLTLAIINGMLVQVGKSSYIIPTISIRQSFKANNENIIIDPDGNEMILVKGECLPIIRLYEMYKIETKITQISEGMIIMAENEKKSVCIFADALIGEQQAVVKALPSYIKRVNGVSGCTLLGNGNISLILDIASIINYKQ